MGHLTIYGFCTDEAKTFKKVKTGFSDGELIQRCHTLILSNFGTKNPEVSTYLKENKDGFRYKNNFFYLSFWQKISSSSFPLLDRWKRLNSVQFLALLS